MGGTAGVSLVLILLAVITFVATLFARETKNESLHAQTNNRTSQ
jgi:MHS family shikimate/dehydroshikimate transporter-like MFS transporter